MVNTFLPLISRDADGAINVDLTMRYSLHSLDKTRLNKQRIEAKQIYTSLTEGGGWSNHPATLMWKGYINLLARYHNIALDLWLKMGCKTEATPLPDDGSAELPWWFGWQALADSHIASLIRKHPFYYESFFLCPTYARERGYIWPTHLEEKYGDCRALLAEDPALHPEWYAKINYDTSKNSEKSFERSFTIAELKDLCRSCGLIVESKCTKEQLLAKFDPNYLRARIRYNKWGR